ncbi:zona pellucida sperm-binding protein 3d.2 isoform X3 [Pygocentrus nattereri]|uniref:zona pellucida sperm-binding protein 3d.2 isoform X3 n=1 Tax=Pygocentrus nattereri TaxID=42514 RepID=UPI001891B529|nr:zona pellucida sperm-binding protein 3d.2 isoform X3 [Pygocentrus nattereri]
MKGLLSPCARAEEGSSVWAELVLPELRVNQNQLGPPYLHLPVFLHTRVPLLDKAHFSPARGSGLEKLPERMRNVLVPPPRPTRPSDAENGRNRLRVACSATQMRVKIPRETVGSAEGLRLGTCDVSWSTKQHLVFLHYLHQCGIKREVINDRVVYSSMLHYTPLEALGSERPLPFSIPVQCHFNRFHYSYKIGFVPQVETLRLFKSMKTKGSVSLGAYDAQWSRLNSSEGYVVGQPMYFELDVYSVEEGERLFVNSCHVTMNNSRLSTPRFSIIDNYGCMVDSRSSSESRFLKSSRRNVVRFSVEAFVFQGKLAKQLYMHCETTVSSVTPTATSKFCTYNQKSGRWEELYGSNALCSCCNSTCLPGAPTGEESNKAVTSDSSSLQVDEYVGEITEESLKVEHLTAVPKEDAVEPRRTFEEVFGLD